MVGRPWYVYLIGEIIVIAVKENVFKAVSSLVELCYRVKLHADNDNLWHNVTYT
jgi:hypothetical protein